MKKILVPTDFSESSFNAALYAMELAKEFSAKITLLNVFHVPNPLQTLPIEIILTPDEFKSDTDSALKKERLKLISAKSFPIEIECMSRNGFSEKEINSVAQLLQADLMVMGMRGHGIIREAIVGSVTTSVIEKSATPVLVVPLKTVFKKPVHIVFASNGKDISLESNLGMLKDIAKNFMSELHIVNIHHPRDFYDKEEIAGRVKNSLSGFKLFFHFIESDKVDETINHFISHNNIDLLAMNTRKHNFFERLFSTSHTKHLAFHSEIPLLVLHE